MIANKEDQTRNNKYKAKFYEGEKTSLRIPVDYTRAGIMEEITDSFALLASKGRRKTSFIVDSIKWADENRKLTILDDHIYLARKIYYCKEAYDLNDVSDFVNLFEDDESLNNIAQRLKKYFIKPAKMTLGFDRVSDRAAEVYDRLGNKPPKERVTIISKAVLDYVKAGNDAGGEALFSDKLLLQLAIDYRSLKGDNDAMAEFLDGLETLLEMADKLLKDNSLL